MEVMETPRPTGTESKHSEEFDRSLVQRIAQGDRAAMQQLFELHCSRITGFFNRLALENEVADELTVETFVSAWDGAGNFDGCLPVSIWLLGLAFRCALRSTNVSRDRADCGDSDLVDEGAKLRFQKLGRAEWLDALSSLPMGHRVAVELTYDLRQSCEETAAIMGCSEAEVRWHVLSATQELRTRLAIVGRHRKLSG